MKKYLFVLGVLAVLAGGHLVYADLRPIPNVDIIVKKNPLAGCKKCLATIATDANGEFKAEYLEDGTYDIYYGNESFAPFATVQSSNGTVSGRLQVDMHVSTTPKVMTFIWGQWTATQIANLKNVLINENVLSSVSAAGKSKIADFTVAVKAFQKKYGIEQTGQLGPKTVQKLNELVK